MRENDLKILVIDEDPARAVLLEEALVSTGYRHVVTIRSTANLRERVALLAPDMIIIDLQNPDREKLNDLFAVTRAVKKPIAMFVDQSDGETTKRAMEAGVSAYIVDGLKSDRVHAVVDVAINRFESFQKLVAERDTARSELLERKLIDRAKGILMEHHNISEDEAYKLLRTTAMRQSRKISAIADSIITVHSIEA